MTKKTTKIIALLFLLALGGCGIFECNHESEIMFPCPIGPCWCNEGK